MCHEVQGFWELQFSSVVVDFADAEGKDFTPFFTTKAHVKRANKNKFLTLAAKIGINSPLSSSKLGCHSTKL